MLHHGCIRRYVLHASSWEADVGVDPTSGGLTCARSRTHSGSQRSSLSVMGSIRMMWSCREERCTGGKGGGVAAAGGGGGASPADAIWVP